MKIAFAKAAPLKGVIVVPVSKGNQFTASGKKLDKDLGGALSKAIKSAPKFEGNKDQALLVNGFSHKTINAVILLGLGDTKSLNNAALHMSGAVINSQGNGLGAKELTVLIDNAQHAVEMGFGAMLNGYRFDKYRMTLKPAQKPTLTAINFNVPNKPAADKAWKEKDALLRGVYLARNLKTEPASELYGATFIKQVKESIKGLPIKIKVLDKAQMKKLGMGALLAVNQGSEHEPYTMILEYNGGGKKKSAPLCLVGKGVTFDTGGYCLKPASMGNGILMSEMKWDMGGAAAVVGTIETLARRKSKANVVGLVGLVENRIDDEAYLPGDVLTSMSGQTIEVLNTDAEGRLVLADVLWYAQETYKPKTVINVATLTGAIIMALADQYAGLFGNDEKLIKQLEEAGTESGDKVWHMPMDAGAEKTLDSAIADIANLGGGAGASFAALFLKRFIKPGVSWAHLDIAGMAWMRPGTAPLSPTGATGFGVRVLDQYIRDNIEK